MAGRIPPEFIDNLLARTDIVELIGSRLALRKAGQNYQALCPFHDEKTASFSVNADKQFYYCFGCSATGSAIGFLMQYNHLSFREAVEELAARLGVDVPVEGSASTPAPDYTPLFHLLEQATALYCHQLRQHPDAPAAVTYLKQRGVSGAIAARYQLGFAPLRGNPILTQLGEDALRRERLLTVGLVSEKEGQHYDRFRHRIIFPIRDRRGRVLGFGGRVLDDTKPKYLNSPETPLFHKGRELYGLWEAQQATRQLTSLVVVEGYLDVIALAQFGITNAVATLGTATTVEQLQLLLRTVSDVTFCFDGDRAGRAAAWKALDTALPLLTGQHTLRFLVLPESDDPDSLIRREGADGFSARLTQAPVLSDFLFAHLAAQVGELRSTESRARFANVADRLLQKIPAGVYRDLLQQRRVELTGALPPAPRPVVKAAAKKGSWGDFQRPSRIAQLVALLFDHPELAATANTIDPAWRRLTEPGVAVLKQMLDVLATHPEMTKAMLLERWREHPHFAYLQQLSVAPFVQNLADGDVAAEFHDALNRMSAEVKKAEHVQEMNPR
ncbi:DNA primase [Chromatium okenii]|uniref:DNA primase n=1 Tax=Chromatium okenii TaxID=61644 RepID=UPI0019087BAA|nr:DNA primase [Chromatium okenii]MBK1642130.1 DNA primase [Chromatium okenii]